MGTTSTTRTRTRTSTCKTPGWWGCLDKTTSHDNDPITTTITTTTSTCLTPGWFGCNDAVASTTPTKATSPPPPVTSAPKDPAPAETSSEPSTATGCHHRNWFGFCKDSIEDEEYVNEEM